MNRGRRLITGSLFMLFAVGACLHSVAEEAQPAQSANRWQASMLLGAHRGGGGMWPENTVYAFTKAAATFPGILLEGDLQMSADGHVVVMHDDTVDRTTDGTGAVKDLTLKQLKALDAGYRFSLDGGSTFPLRGQGITIPTFDEVLAALPEERLLMELKRGENVTASVLAVIQQYKAEQRMLLASFSPVLMKEVRELAPNIATCYDLGTAMGMLQALRKGDWENYTPTAQVLSLPKKYVTRFSLTADEIARIRDKGIVVQVHTLNTPESMKTYIDMGVDSILTDYPDRLHRVMNQKK